MNKRSTIIFTLVSIVVFVVILAIFLPGAPEVAKEPSLDIQYWYNFKTQQSLPWVGLPTNLPDYLPHDSAAQNMYILLIENLDLLPIDAYLQVMNTYLGEP